MSFERLITVRFSGAHKAIVPNQECNMPIAVIVVFFCVLILAAALVTVEGLRDEAPVGACVKGGVAFIAVFAVLYLAAASEVGIV